MRPAPGDDRGGGGVDGAASAGDAHRRGRVEEPAARGGRRGDPLLGRRRRDQEDPVQPVRRGGREPLVRLVRDEVRGDHPEPARGREVPGEGVDPVAQHRVEVGHDDGRTAGGADPLDDGEDVAHPEPGAQRRVRGGLDRRAVHHGVRVRDPDLEEVAPALDGGGEQLDRAVDGRVAGGQVADERAAALRGAPGEDVGHGSGRDTHSWIPSVCAPGIGERGVRRGRTQVVGDRGALRDRRAVGVFRALPLADHAEPLRGGVDVLVAAPREVHEDHRVRPELAAQLERAGDRVRALDRRDDPLGPREQRERVHRRGVGDGPVLRPAEVLEQGVLGPDTGIVQPRRDRVRLGRLPVVVLQQVAQRAVQRAG